MPRSPRRERQPLWPWLLLAPGLLWLLLLYLLPLLGLVPLSLSEPVSRFGLETVFRGRFVTYLEVARDQGPILLRSIRTACIATALGLLLAYPLALLIRFREIGRAHV